ncbi:type IX secretion system membrane protein PorP/SprF [Marinilabiliaceae bacterium ANBcel2]|nr:type IX secretion system membrane protein PorP/SprF [Marinilabiliaceae bacterium ANBcel2]
MQLIIKKIKIATLTLIILIIGGESSCIAQLNSNITQYINNPVWLNPAFAGTRNALAVDITTRQQWMGLDGAPSTYFVGTHAPINRTLMSIGGAVITDIAGPITNHQLSFSYSYLLRVNEQMFLSAGINGGAVNHSLNLSDLDIIDQNDPHFQQSIENEFKPLIGAGAVLFTPRWYAGFSSPQLLSNETDYPEISSLTYNAGRVNFFTAGINYTFTQDIRLRLFSLITLAENHINSYDIGAKAELLNKISVGFNYRHNNSAAIMAGYRINENIEIGYSYDFPINDNLHNISNQEITLSFDFYNLIIPNRDRQFIRKTREDEDASESIRFF